MTEREIAFLQSLDKVVDSCTKKSDDFKILPTFNENVLVLDGLAKSMHHKIQDLELNDHDYSKVKNLSKFKMIAETLSHAALILAYAGVNRSFVVPNAAKVTTTSLSRLRENALADVCRAVLNICIQMEAELSPFGLTKEGTTTLEGYITDFEVKLIGSPEYNASNNSIKASFKSDYDQAEDILTNTLDPLAELLKKTNPNAYSEYWQMRKIVLPGSRTMALKGRTVNAATGDAVQGATITLVKTDTGETNKKAGGSELDKGVKRSTEKGGFQFQTLASGTYTLTAAKAGYTCQPMTVYVNDGEMTAVEIRMVKL